MVELIASQPNIYCHISAPDHDHSIRFYRDGSWVDDERGKSGFLDFKEVMKLEAMALSAHLPQISTEDYFRWFDKGKSE